MKLTFKMTADEFYRGFNFKTNKLGMNETCELVCLTVFLVLAAILTFTGVLKDTFLLILSIMLMLFFVFKMKKTQSEFMMRGWNLSAALKKFMHRGKVYMQ